jgi:chlorobactene glucosyltransferase
MVTIGTSIIFILVAMLAITLLNLITFPRLRPNEPVLYPQVSILIPVRDEAPIIKKTLAAWREQSCPNFEIIVLDDESQDSTYHIVNRIVAQDSRLHLLRGSKLPSGWTGKNWACFQLAESAQGEIIIFSDADVHWQPAALSGLVQSMQIYQSDLLTVWPSQKVFTWAERLVIPLMNFAVFCYLPEIFVRKVPLAAFAAANDSAWHFEKRLTLTLALILQYAKPLLRM